MGVTRAAAFTPEALGRGTLASYRAALAAPPRSSGFRVAVCTPCRPTPGDAAGHALDLLSALPQRGDVEVFTDDPDGPVPDEVLDGFPVHHLSSLARVHADRPFDAVLYNATPACDGVDARSVAVERPPLGTSDPCRGRPRLESILARARLGWSTDRLTALVFDPSLADAVPTWAEAVLADPDDLDDDRLLACNLVVAADRPGQRVALVRAAAAGKPLLLAGPDSDVEWPPSFVERLTGIDEFPENLAERSAAARAWFEAEANLDQVVAFYGRLLGEEEPPQPEDLTLPGRALADLGVLTADARILSLGLDGADVAFRLTREVHEVTLAAPWLDNGGTPASRAMLVDPTLLTTVPFDPARLVIRHTDLRRLPFPDGAFDAVVAWRALDALDEEAVARALAEVARVTRPGGHVVLSLAVRLHGRAGSAGISLDSLLGRVLPSTGLEPVDEVPEVAMTARRAFSSAFRPLPVDTDEPVAVRQGAVFGRLALTLRAGQPPVAARW